MRRRCHASASLHLGQADGHQPAREESPKHPVPFEQVVRALRLANAAACAFTGTSAVPARNTISVIPYDGCRLFLNERGEQVKIALQMLAKIQEDRTRSSGT